MAIPFILIPIVLFLVWGFLDYSGKPWARRLAGTLLGLAATFSYLVIGALSKLEANSYCN